MPALRKTTLLPDFTQRYFLGLDLGKRVDRSALAILELEWQGDSFDSAEYAPIRNSIVRLVRADRVPLRLPYSRILEILADVLAKLERRPVLRRNAADLFRKDLVVDAANAGSFLLEILQQHKLPAALVLVSNTGGERENRLDGGI